MRTNGENPDTLNAGTELVSNLGYISLASGVGNVAGSATLGLVSAATAAADASAADNADVSGVIGQVVGRFTEAWAKQQGFALWIKVEYQSCEPCWCKWIAGAKFVDQSKWYQCTAGSSGGQGFYGGDPSLRQPLPKPKDIVACIKDALS